MMPSVFPQQQAPQQIAPLPPQPQSGGVEPPKYQLLNPQLTAGAPIMVAPPQPAGVAPISANNTSGPSTPRSVPATNDQVKAAGVDTKPQPPQFQGVPSPTNPVYMNVPNTNDGIPAAPPAMAMPPAMTPGGVLPQPPANFVPMVPSAFPQPPAMMPFVPAQPPAPGAAGAAPANTTAHQQAQQQQLTPSSIRSKEALNESKIYVRHLPSTTTQEHLRAFFSNFGNISSCTMHRERGGSGFCSYITYDSLDAAAIAIRQANGATEFQPKGRGNGYTAPLSVRMAETLNERNERWARRTNATALPGQSLPAFAAAGSPMAGPVPNLAPSPVPLSAQSAVPMMPQAGILPAGFQAQPVYAPQPQTSPLPFQTLPTQAAGQQQVVFVMAPPSPPQSPAGPGAKQ